MLGTVVSGLFRKVISEVYKSKIDELEKRMLTMEQRHGVIEKVMTDNERKIDNLEMRLMNNAIEMRELQVSVEFMHETIYTKKRKRR